MSENEIWEQNVWEPDEYDVVGDVHGCLEALHRLTAIMGYDRHFRHPRRKLVFVGDLINRGPDSVGVLRTVMDLVRTGAGYAVLGNHDDALLQWLRDPNTPVKDDMAATITTISRQPDAAELWPAVEAHLAHTPLILNLDQGRLTVVHAGMEQGFRERRDPEARRYLLNGEAIGKSPEGKTLRRDWAKTYHDTAFIAYGHTPVPRAEIRYNTANLDTGAARGRLLSALRWPEKTTVSVPAPHDTPQE